MRKNVRDRLRKITETLTPDGACWQWLASTWLAPTSVMTIRDLFRLSWRSNSTLIPLISVSFILFTHYQTWSYHFLVVFSSIALVSEWAWCSSVQFLHSGSSFSCLVVFRLVTKRWSSVVLSLDLAVSLCKLHSHVLFLAGSKEKRWLLHLDLTWVSQDSAQSSMV